MRLLIQRVKKASVSIHGQVKSTIGNGLLLLLGIEATDTQADIDYLVKKTANLRIFNDDQGVMNRSVLDIQGEILCVSQFTLYADTKKGNRPSYIRAAKPEIAIPLYEQFCLSMSLILNKSIQTGTFGADMQVELVNDGPVTIGMDSKK